MRKTMILLGFLALAPFAKGQLLLEALEGGQNEKCIERVKDKHYGDGEHNFIYCAVQGPNGKKWLNLNLGAEYAREGSEYFNPEAVPTDYNDWKAYGSLFQWSRGADGHELGKYYIPSGSEQWYYQFKNPIGTYQLSGNEVSNQTLLTRHGWHRYIGNDTRSPWLYDGETVRNPCPSGYSVMTDDNFLDFIKTTSYEVGNHHGYKGTARIVNSNSYPNLNLMFAPILFNRDHTGVSSTDLIDKENYGTSGLRVATKEKVQRAVDYDRLIDILPAKRFYATWVDNGIKAGDKPYDFGIIDAPLGVGDLKTSVAVRCVEK